MTLELAQDVLGTTGRAFMFDFADALIDFDAGRALNMINDAMNRGRDPQVFMRDVTSHLRGLLLAGAVGDVTELLEITPEDGARFAEQCRRIDPVRLARLMELFMRAEPDMKWATRPRTVLELAAVRACHPEQEQDAALSERMERVEKLVEGGVRVVPAAEKAKRVEEKKVEEKPKPAPVKAGPAVQPPKEYLDALERVAGETPSIKATLPSMRFVAFDGSVVTVEFSKKQMMHMKMLERKKALFDGALSEAFGQPVSIHMQLEGEKTARAATGSTARRVIEESYEVFGRDKIDLQD